MKQSLSAILSCGLSAAVLCAASPAIAQVSSAAGATLSGATTAGATGTRYPKQALANIPSRSVAKYAAALAAAKTPPTTHNQDPFLLKSSVLHAFAGSVINTDGIQPEGQLMEASDGSVYGTTSQGGVMGDGSIYEYTPAGKYAQVYSFTGQNDGSAPYTGLIEAADGNLYGTTSAKGQGGGGALYQYNLATQQVKALYGFTNGGSPLGDIIDDGNGTLYGVTIYGGELGYGSIWSWNYYTNTFKTLYSFQGSADGAEPVGGLVLASDGRLYGTAQNGGKLNDTGYGNGTVFTLNTDGSDFNAFYSFSDFTTALDGMEPGQDLVEGPDGNLYGTTQSGGFQNAQGALFQVIPNGAGSTVNALAVLGQDALAEGGLVTLGRPLIAGDGYLYLVGSIGGYEEAGQLMRFDYQGNETDIYDYEQPNDDYSVQPNGGVIETQAGNFYGTAPISPFAEGVLYSLPTALPPVITLTPSVTAAYVGIPFTMKWAANNVFSQNASVCIARSSDGTFGGAGGGASVEVVGSQLVVPEAAGTVTYSLTCGGVETATATLTVNKIPSKTSVTHLTTPLLYGQSVVFTTKVATTMGSRIPTGIVSLMNGTKVLGTATLSGGVATITASSLSLVPGTYPLQVAYSGDGTYLASTSSATALTVSQLVPAITLVASPNRITQGLATKLTVTINNGGVDVPNGYVNVTIGSTQITPLALGSGSASVEVDSAAYAAGTYTITAAYQGDPYNKSEKTTTSLVLTKAETSTVVNGPTTFAAGTGATFNVTVGRFNLPETPTGTVTLKFGSKVVGSGTLTNGQVAINVPVNAITAGTYGVQALYSGDANDSDSLSQAVSVSVSK